jgi:integral membrane sensor domain MASE1
MARSHHRKKHKEHLRQFRHSQDTTAPKSGKGKTVGLFTTIGAALGFAVSYFAAQGSAVWIGIAMIAGAITGYFIGHKIDTQKQ